MSGVRNLKLEVILAAIDQATRPIKAVMGSSKGLSKQLKETRDRMKELGRQQASLERFKDISRALAVTKNQLHTATVKLRGLKDEFSKTESPTKQLTDAIRAQQTEIDKLQIRHGKLNAHDVQLQETLKKAGLETKNLSAQQRRLKSETESLLPVLSKQQKQLEQINKIKSQHIAARASYDKGMGMRDRIAGAGVGMMGAGMATGAAAVMPVINYAQAEDSAMQLKVSMMGAGGQVKKEYTAISALAERLGNKLPGTTAELQEMMTMLNRQGMSAKAILGGVGEASAYLAVQLKLPYTQAAEYAAKLQDATGALESDMMGVMDTIQRTYQVGVDPQNMVAGFAKLSPVLDMIGQKGLAGAKAMAPLLAMADQKNLVGESAGNAYRKVFQRAMDAKKIAASNKALKKQKTGVHLDFTNGKGEFGSLDKMFNQLAQLQRLNTQQRNRVIADIWGDDAETLQALNIMMKNGKAEYVAMQKKMADQATLQQRVNAQLGTLKNLWDAATGTFTNALVRFGEAIAPEAKEAVRWIGDLSEKLGTWAKQNPELANTIMKTVAVVAILLTTLGGVALAVSAALGPFVMMKFALTFLGITLGNGAGALGILANAFNLVMKAAGLVGTVMMWLARIFLMNPIGLAITVIAAGAYLIWRNWDTLGPKFHTMWSAIKQAFASGWGWIKTTSSAALNWFFSLPGKFMTLGTQIMHGLVNGISAGLGAVKSAITGAGDATIGWFKEKLGIHSPSRVFAELGGFTMAGLHQGITKGQTGPLSAVLSVAKKLTAVGASAAIGTASGMVSAANIDHRAPLSTQRAPTTISQPQPIVINVHPAPGMNEGELAQMVAREVERIQRKTAARDRSKLADRD